MKNLQDILPLYGVEQDMILSKMGDLTICYQLELPEIFTLSNAEYEAFHQTWVKAGKVLPEGCVLHKQDWYVQERFAGDFEKDHSFLPLSSERFFHERPYLAHQCYLMLTLRPRNRKSASSLGSTLLRKHIVPVETIDPAFAKTFEGICSQFVRLLCDSGFVAVKRMVGEELVKLVNRYLLLSEDGVLRDLAFDKGIQVGEKHCELFTLASTDDLPGYCGSRMDYEKYGTDTVKFPIGFASPLGQLLGCDHIYNQYFFIEDSASIIKQLEARKKRLQALCTYARENAYAREAVDLFLNEAIAEQRTIVRAHFNVLAWTEDTTRVQEIRNQCSAAFAQLDATPKIETVGAPQIYWAGIPGNAGDLPSNETFTTFSHQACSFLNLETNYQSSESPVGIRLGDRLSGRPLHVDLSDEPMRRGVISNRNKFILGPSGSGKSFFTNHFLRSYYEQGAHIVIVDVGHSYRGLCNLVGGYYFTYTEEKPITFNPFYVGDREVLDTEKKESIKSLLLTLWKKENDPFTRTEYVALSKALKIYYDTNIKFACFNSFYEFLADEYVAILERDHVREKDFDVHNFLYVLRPFYKGGEFDFLLNATENLDLVHKRFIVFEMDNIKDHPILYPVVAIIVMEMFVSKMRQLPGVLKELLIEEAWKQFMKDTMANYLKERYKTMRKFSGEAIIVTQEIDDVISSPIVKETIINNSDCIILLDQSKYENRFDDIQKLLGLTDKQKALVLSVNKANDPIRKYKEVFISLGGKISKVYRVEVSPEEYLAYTTEEREKLRVSLAAENCGSMEAGIKSLTN
ncbi:MAG: TraG family conjugative transposon ATPase [Sediminibacterium magnilacihabitans]|jgi:conjugation system TraG family ATPase|nr:TraG family conjugative transposon ATPase [Sediminibacterium magnilacihabitans]PQV60417.1 conjugation system TraG family ATPase [Sediminibacterium magnilacihabitans]